LLSTLTPSTLFNALSTGRGAVDNYDRDDEEKSERLDRNWNELLQELRISQTGVQILTGFLLTMPLQPKFADLSVFTRNAYAAAVTLSLIATVLLIAPASLHRMLFRQNLKESIVVAADKLAKAGLSGLGAAMTAVAALIFGIAFGDSAGQAAGGLTLVMFLIFWVGLPLVIARESHR
jgi:Family of unknown function (DUF6328)